MKTYPDTLAWPAYLFVAAWIIATNAYSYYMLLQGCDVRTVDNIDTILMSIIAIFLFFQPAAGFPSPLDKRISNKKRFWTPALAGIIFGLLDILVIRGILHPEPYTTLPPFLQPFPYSVFLYINGALY
ncbi:MAG TPA: hypothetical protein VLA58_06175, partial [Chitinophagaceae bacterium]|nr:hypothetical protein [Chitinophagaceae bacterium]